MSDPKSWFSSDEDELDPNDPAFLSDIEALLGSKSVSDSETDESETSSEEDSNTDPDSSQDDPSNSSESPEFDPTAYGLPLSATPDSIREAFEFWQNRNNQPIQQQPPVQPSFPPAPGVTPPQNFLGSGDAGEYDTDPRILAEIQRLQQVQNNYNNQLLQQQHIQIQQTTNSAVSAFQQKYDIDNNLMATIRSEAANSKLLVAAMSNSTDPYQTVIQVLEATAFSNPILRDKILNKPDDKAAETKKTKLNSLGGTSKSTRTAPVKPLSQQEKEEAFLKELEGAFFSS